MKKLLFIVLLLFGCASVQSDAVLVNYKGKLIKEFPTQKEYNDTIFFSDSYRDMLDNETTGRMEVATKKPEHIRDNIYNIPVKIEWHNPKNVLIKRVVFNLMIDSNEFFNQKEQGKKLDVKFSIEGKL